MKTRNFIPALSLALILIGMTAIYARPISNPTALGEVKKDITYVINVAHDDHLDGFKCTFYIVLTDERGNLIAPPQQFRLGVWSYQVKEKGNVTGTRVAKMVRAENLLCPGAYTFSPDSKTGTFKGGETYQFIVTPMAGGGAIKD